MHKINLLNINYDELIFIFEKINEKKFRATQIFNWIYKKDVIDLNQFSNFDKEIKKKISDIFFIKIPKITKEEISNDNTIKWLIEIKNNEFIETVAIPNKKGNFTICLSSQLGCISNCSFCLTAKQGFLRNLNTDEIIGQIYNAKTRIKKIFNKKHQITNIVLMGMGEPLLNYNNVSNAIKIIKNKQGYNISQNNITLSTCGITPGIEKLNEHNITLAVSLHATNDNLRTKLMPINKKYNIENILNACKKYKSKNPITFEYILIKDINDSIKDAEELTKLLKNIRCKVCIIPFNKFEGSKYNEPDTKDIINFKKHIEKSNIITTIRKSMGKDINAACGQLKGKFADITNRKKIFEKKNEKSSI